MLSLSIANVSIVEPTSGTAQAVFTVTLDAPSSDTVSVQYGTADGTALSGIDYRSASGTLTFAPGETTQSFEVPIIGGRPSKPSDQFTIALSNPQNDTIDPTQGVATGTILPASGLSINDVSVVEGTSGTTDAIFTVTLDPPNIEEPVTVDYSTADGTAKAGVDYQAVSGTLTYQPDETTQTIDVPIIGGTNVKPPETFLVNLTNATNAVIDRGTGTGTIVDNSQGGSLQFSSPTYSVGMNAGTATITVTRTNGNASDVGVAYSTSGGTAVPGVDYTPVSGTLNFAANQSSQTFTIPILSSSSLGADKTVGLVLGNPTGGGSLGNQSLATLSIVNSNSLVVTNTNDSGKGSLRQAILSANATTGTDTITFDIPGAGPFTIKPLSALPTITDPVNIDATTEPGYQGSPLIEIDGEAAGTQVDGLTINAGGSLVEGLAINRFQGSGILLQQGGGNRVIGDRIGTDLSGQKAQGNRFDGIEIDGSANNTIGGSDPASANLISGNGIAGVQITGASSTGNVIAGNLIGTDLSGKKSLGNASAGVYLDGVSNTLLGGSGSGSRNVISGNNGAGVQITGQVATGNRVQGNLIGTDISGASSLGNALDGIYLEGSANNTIGGNSTSLGNLISGNGLTGIRIVGNTASGNLIEGNQVGTNLAGSRALGNRFDGIFVNGAPSNTIGGDVAGTGNVISGNGGVGVQLYGEGTSGNAVEGNLIGTDGSGLKAVPNLHDGVYLNRAVGNTIGGATAGARNVISGNRLVGVQFSPSGSTANIVQGNLIGANINGQPSLGNDFGLFLDGAVGNTIGGAGDAANLIAGNHVANNFQGSSARVSRRSASGQSQSKNPIQSQSLGDGPVVTQVTPTVANSVVTSVVLTFDEPLDPSRAQSIRNYRLRLAGRSGGFTGQGAVPIPLNSATYDAATNRVTLNLVAPLDAARTFQLRVVGTGARGLTDSNGNPLRIGDGGSAGDYVAVLGNGGGGTRSNGAQ
ncbi:beta strand repeat-containing protein [Singulisphaera rosea]